MFRRKKEEVYEISVSGIPIEVSRKRIKNFYVRVHRNTGTVRVSCPFRISDYALEQFIRSKFGWIRKQQAKAALRKPKLELEYVQGETIFFEGKEYLLDVKEGAKKSEVEIKDSLITIYTKSASTKEKREEILELWYRDKLREKIPEIIEKYESKMGVKVQEFRIKKMKTRWGTCNIKVGRIWLSLGLAKKSLGCLEMVVVHEMVHLLERLHNKRFYNLMDDFMPNWRVFNQELNSSVD